VETWFFAVQRRSSNEESFRLDIRIRVVSSRQGERKDSS
jgi:hypothetical protein